MKYKITPDNTELNNSLKLLEKEINDAVTFALGELAEEMRSEIVQQSLAPRVWNKNENFKLMRDAKSFPGSGLGKVVGARFGQAVNIAKREGFSDFSRGVEATFTATTKTGKPKKIKTTIFSGRGWKRAMELFPFMTAGQRPGGNQVLWGHQRSGRTLRNSIEWVVLDKAGQDVAGSVTQRNFTVAGRYSTAVITSPLGYAEKHEDGAYPFMTPVANELVRSGKAARFMDSIIERQLRKRGLISDAKR